MKPVGYLINTREGLEGKPGLFYDYILAQNGLFIRAQGPLLKATVQVVPAEVRGLMPLGEEMELPQGRVPRCLYDLALSMLADDPSRERYLAITWEGQYRLREPPQERRPCSVTYERPPHTVVDIHSHGELRGFFSETDDRDQEALAVDMVVGRLGALLPDVAIRVSAYGYYVMVSWEKVFQ